MVTQVPGGICLLQVFVPQRGTKAVQASHKLGKVAIGKARYLLNIVLCTWMFKSSLFRFSIWLLLIPIPP